MFLSPKKLYSPAVGILQQKTHDLLTIGPLLNQLNEHRWILTQTMFPHEPETRSQNQRHVVRLRRRYPHAYIPISLTQTVSGPPEI